MSERHLEHIVARLTEMALQKGACDADAIAIASTSESIAVRHGETESIERNDAQGVGLRMFLPGDKGLRFASASTSNLSDQGLQYLVTQIWDMVNISEPDPDAVPASGANYPGNEEIARWEQEHPVSSEPWNTHAAKDAALACEDAALSYSSAISNSEGAEASFGLSHIAYANAEGFHAAYQKTSTSLSCSVIAGTGDNMQRDYAFSRAMHANELRTATDIGHEAATRTAQRLGASSMPSCNLPIIFEPRIATSFIGHLLGAINGRAILQKRSFLHDACGKKLFPDWVNIQDHPNHPQGLGNRLFDAEGTRCAPMPIIQHGTLTTFLTDRYAAGRLGTTPTGHARRGLTGDTSIGTSNIIIEPGNMMPEEIYADIGNGVLITELIGFGVNPTTGDYSRGAAGFLIENGVITRPVQEITIAGNLLDMFQHVSHIGNDMTWLGSMGIASIALENMAIAGNQQ